MQIRVDDALAQGVGLMDRGNDNAAATVFFSILKYLPAHPVALNMIGALAGKMGRNKHALLYLKRTVAIAPDYAEAIRNLGAALLIGGDLKAAVERFETALNMNADDFVTLCNLGTAHLRLGNHLRAVDCLMKARKLNPDSQAVTENLAAAYSGMAAGLRLEKKYSQAETMALKALNITPANAKALCNYAGILKDTKKNREALKYYQLAVLSEPDFADAKANLGIALMDSGQLELAQVHLEKAVGQAPENPLFLTALGDLRKERDLNTEAAKAYLQALQYSPAFSEALNNHGNLLWDSGEIITAEKFFSRAAKADPMFVEAYNNRAISLQETGNLRKAADLSLKALSLNPAFPQAMFNYAHNLSDAGCQKQAALFFERALFLDPEYNQALSMLVHLKRHICDWKNLEDMILRQRHIVRKNPTAEISPGTFISEPVTPFEQYTCAVNWANARLNGFSRKTKVSFTHSRQRRAGKIRLGYLSADYSAHATTVLISELFELHDKSRFEVHAFSYGKPDSSPAMQRIVKAVDEFADIRFHSHVQTAEEIYKREIDILIDLKGYTKFSRPQIPALRPAPINVSWLGYPGTSGADFMDYFVGDDFATPKGAEKYFSEKLIVMPHCYQINDRKRAVPEKFPTRGECGLPEKGFVFCSFNGNYKITPQVFDVWMSLLKRKQGSVLWLLESNADAAQNLRRETAARGVEPERIVFAPRIPLKEHLARHIHADLFLDTNPVNAHTTASDALWAGVPLVTMAGETFVSRVAGSILRAAGLDDLIIYTLEDYESFAGYLADTPAELLKYKNHLENNRLNLPLFDSPGFTRALETAYGHILELYTAGQSPESFRLLPSGDGFAPGAFRK